MWISYDGGEIFECRWQEVYGVGHLVFCRHMGLREICMQIFCCICNNQWLGFALDFLDAVVVMERRSYIKAFTSSLIPWSSFIWSTMDAYITTYGYQRCLCIIKGTVEVFPFWHAWVECVLTNKVECQFCPHQEVVPHKLGEVVIYSSEHW